MKRKTGWNEWSGKRMSLFTGCRHDCRYCFARKDALRFHRIPSRDLWAVPVERKFCRAEWQRKYAGVVACFGTHDITPENVSTCASAIEMLCGAGNRLLIVTKPHPECIAHLCGRLAPWKDQVEFRFTVGADDDELLQYWEPGAPRFAERMEAALWARANHFKLSFSVEPMLDAPYIFRLIGRLKSFQPAAIWIGTMNHIRERVVIETPEDMFRVGQIETGQREQFILHLVAALKNDPVIRWKAEIQEVIERAASEHGAPSTRTDEHCKRPLQ
jgi:hypothetical protein